MVQFTSNSSVTALVFTSTTWKVASGEPVSENACIVGDDRAAMMVPSGDHAGSEQSLSHWVTGLAPEPSADATAIWK